MNHNYLSPELVSKLISLIGHQRLRQVLQNIRDAKWFAAITDEVRDTVNAGQLTVSFRWSDNNYSIHEDPIGLVQVPKTDAETHSSALRDVLARCMLPLNKYRGQAYDGTSNISGPKIGVLLVFLRKNQLLERQSSRDSCRSA